MRPPETSFLLSPLLLKTNFYLFIFFQVWVLRLLAQEGNINLAFSYEAL